MSETYWAQGVTSVSGTCGYLDTNDDIRIMLWGRGYFLRAWDTGNLQTNYTEARQHIDNMRWCAVLSPRLQAALHAAPQPDASEGGAE